MPTNFVCLFPLSRYHWVTHNGVSRFLKYIILSKSILPQEYGFVGLPDVSNKSILPQEYGFVGLPDVRGQIFVF